MKNRTCSTCTFFFAVTNEECVNVDCYEEESGWLYLIKDTLLFKFGQNTLVIANKCCSLLYWIGFVGVTSIFFLIYFFFERCLINKA